MTRHYEAVVIGGRLSAVLAGALLAKRGLRTLLVDQGELASTDRYLVPDLVASPAESAVMERVHEELGVRLDQEQRLEPVRPSLQVIFPDERIELAADRDALLQEIGRSAPDAVDPTAAALARVDEVSREVGGFLSASGELPATGFFKRRTAQQNLRKHGALSEAAADGVLSSTNGAFRATVVGLLPFLTHLDARRGRALSAARLARPVARWLRGQGQLEVDGGLRAMFMELAQRRAFDVHRGAISSLTPGKPLSIELAQSSEPITAEVLIDASTDLSGIETIPSRLQKKDLALTLQAAKPKGHLHTLGVEVDAHVLPPGMGRYLLLLNGRRDPERLAEDGGALEDRPILVVRRPAAEEGREELVCAHPVSAVRAHEEGLDRLEAAMKARLQRLVPFLDDGRPTSRALSGRGATRDHRPVLSHPLYDPELDAELGLTGVSMRTPYKAVFLGGPAVLPGLGVEGEYWSALQAVEAATVFRTGGKPKKRLLE